VNGARSSNILDWMQRLGRSSKLDRPMILFYHLVGNDVCSTHEDFTHMTTPDEFYNNIKKSLDYMETALAPDSHIIFIGLAQGNNLFNFLSNRTHVWLKFSKLLISFSQLEPPITICIIICHAWEMRPVGDG
jgi:acyloxyacyl hydrolase